MKKLVAMLTIVMIMLTSAALALDAATPTEIRATPTEMRAADWNAGAQRPSFDTFGEALAAAFEDAVLYGDTSCATIVKADGVYYRFKAKYDNEAKRLWKESLKAKESDEPGAEQDFHDCIKKLPAKYDGEFTGEPLEQAELDRMAGKTVAEAKKAGYSFVSTKYDEPVTEITCVLVNDYYDYEIILNESYDVYQEHHQKGKYDDLTIRSIGLSGHMFSAKAWNMDVR